MATQNGGKIGRKITKCGSDHFSMRSNSLCEASANEAIRHDSVAKTLSKYTIRKAKLVARDCKYVRKSVLERFLEMS